MFKIIREDGNKLMVEAHGRVDKDDYDKFLPLMEELMEKYDKINCVTDLGPLNQ